MHSAIEVVQPPASATAAAASAATAAAGTPMGSMAGEAPKCREDRLRLLYPAVDESETPLPRGWSPIDKFTYIGLSLNNLRVHYKGTGKNHKDAASVRATDPIPAACGIYYFEVKIVSKGRDGYMGVGLSAKDVSMNRLPGWDKDSYGYHGDDGHSFCSSGTGQPYGPTFTTGDIIGCGVNLIDNTCFYTKNGQNLGVAFTDLPPDLYPTVGLQTPGEVIDANFGVLPFLFDIESVIQEARERTRLAIETFPVADSQGEFQTVLHRIVLTYLAHHGFAEAAVAFAKATDQTLSESIESIKNRQRIQLLVMAGRIDEAIALTRQLYPDLLDSKPGLLFQLKCRQFVEMVFELNGGRRDRRSSGCLLANTEENGEHMDVEETPRASELSAATSASGDIDGVASDGKITFAKILEFGKELYELEKTLKDRDGKSKQLLFEACALLAYSDPWQSPVAYLLNASQREPVCCALNNAILESLGVTLQTPLETALAHCKQLVKEMARHGLGACAYADVFALLN